MNSRSRYSEDDGIHIGEVTDNLTAEQPPHQDDCLLHGSYPAPEHVHVITTQYALKQVVAHSESNLSVELGGVLLGKAFRADDRLFVRVEAAIPAVTDDNGPVHFTFTADAWTQIHVDRMAYPSLDIVGWFHTHPDLGVFYSADDEVVHSAAFTQPWHVGLVVDPVRNQGSFFGWIDGLPRPLPGFYELIPADAGEDGEVPRAVVDWDVVIDHSWFMPPHTAGAAPHIVYNDGIPPEAVYLPMAFSLVAMIISMIALYFSLR